MESVGITPAVPLRGMIAPASLKLHRLVRDCHGVRLPLRGMIAPASLKQRPVHGEWERRVHHSGA